MANSISAEVWLDERRWDALEVVLEEQGSNIEQHLQEYLLDLYREMVPPDQVREIESDIQKEALETQREREARKVFSAFRLWENGKSRCLATEYPKDFLDTARLLRKHLLEKAGGADDFARKINGGYDISLSRFEELTLARVDNSRRVAGVFELDFDRQVFSATHILDGWKSYRFQDVSAAAYQAFRKEHSSQEERCTVQMEVFGPEAKCAKTGSWLDIYVSYDVARQEVRDHLDLTLHRKDGAWEKSFRYDLTPEEQELLRTELETHCQNRYGQTLNGLYAERYRLEGCEPLVLDGGTRRLDMSAVSFEEEPMECCGKLNFYIPVTFDPDAVFGTHVASESNDDWLNVYANFDLEAGEPEKALTVVLVCSDGHEFEFSYHLTAPEREQLREKMEDYCQAQTGMSLEKYRQELCSEEPSMEQGHQL